MAKLIWTDHALKMLKAIRDYVGKQNPPAAQRLIESIYNKTTLLENFPRLGYVHSHHDDVERRVVLFGNYRIPYRIDGDAVTILGVYHTARLVDPDEL